MTIKTENNNAQFALLGILTLVLLGTILYAHIFHAPFVYDDYRSILRNDSIGDINASIKNVASSRYLPLLSFASNFAINGQHTFGYHLINNALHIMNTLLVYYLVLLIFRTPALKDAQHSGRFIAFSTAFIFVSHPIQTQAVTYIVQRATVMATFFYLGSAVLFIKARLALTYKHKALFLYVLSLLSAVLAMKSKEIAFTVPAVIVLIEFFFFNEQKDSFLSPSTAKRILLLLPLMLTVLIIPLSRIDLSDSFESVRENLDFQSRETTDISRTTYFLTQFRVIITYLRLLMFPINQSFDYDYPLYHTFLNPHVFFPFMFLLVLLLLSAYCFYISRRHRLLRMVSFGIFWFFIALSVESSIIPIRDIIVEHRLYLPSIGFFIAGVSFLVFSVTPARIKAAIVIVVVVLLSYGTYIRNTVWKSPETLWEDVIMQFPDNARAYNNLGVYYKNEREFFKAVIQFEKSLKANRDYTAVYYNLGDVHYEVGDYDNALDYLTIALSKNPGPGLHLDILNKIGRTYGAMGQTDDAIETFQKALKRFPSAVILYNNLGVQYIKNGTFDMAIEIFNKALAIREEPYLRANLSVAYAGAMEKKKMKSTINTID